MTLKAGRARADEAEDLRDATTDELRDVSVTSSEPIIVVELGVNQAVVTTLDGSDAAKALVDDCHALIATRKTMFTGYLPALLIGGCWFSLGLFLLAIAIFNQRGDTTGIVVSGLIIFTGPLWFLTVARDATKNGYAVIVPNRPSERRISKETVVVIIVTSILSAGITFLATYWQIRSAK